ncbi:MAG: FMN-binding protein, partial [Prevotella sp.]|nr:FMN-binding protein [Prevotella sp.]
MVNTTTLGKDIVGYGGNVPLEISVKNNVVTDIKALDNSETPQFFDKAKVLLEAWKGTTVDEAIALHVDGVTGATFSSNAIKNNVACGLEYLSKNKEAASAAASPFQSVQFIAGLLVALMAAVLPLVTRSRVYHTVQ